MLKLPKVDKVVGTGLTKVENVKKIVLAAALGFGLSVAGSVSNSDAVSNEPIVIAQTHATANQGALLLVPRGVSADQQQIAQHYSHSSHSSHFSHSSHQSHYSSR